jgi:hypothetical protein
MSNYTKSTNFATKDALTTGNPLKTVSGTEIDDEFTNIATAVATKANLSSPTLTGTPAAPTASSSTNSTQIATTAFTQAAIVAGVSAKAPIDAPTFTGVPAAPTAAAGTNTTQLATTEFATAAVAALNLATLEYSGSVKATAVSGGLNVTGALVATGDVTAFSDSRLKDNIETIGNAVAKVKAMRGVTYDMNGKRGLGVIAQETESVIPEVVMTHDSGLKSVAYGNIVGLLIEAIKEQQVQINELKAGA